MHNVSLLVSEYCENVFLRCEGSTKLIIFLPSANGKNLYPYYPRKSWGEALSKDHNVLYVSDPYQPLPQYKESMGSWFISPTGDLTLNFLAEKLTQLIEDNGIDDVIFYGSSMGGYAAIILSSLVRGSKAIAECPQLYLNKYPGSRFVCQSILNKDTLVENIEPLFFLKKSKPKYLRIISSVFDHHHYSQHILPFFNELRECLDNQEARIDLFAYINHNYSKGHVALDRNDGLRAISEVRML